MIKKDKHQHKAPYSKVKIIEDLLIKSDLGKTKWHRIFGLCLVLRPYDNNGNTLVNSSFKHIQIFDGKKWRDIKEADMGHIDDAVSWWNKTGRQYGAKSKEVREWMLDSKNYVLEYYKTNRSNGAKLLEKYLPPLK